MRLRFQVDVLLATFWLKFYEVTSFGVIRKQMMNCVSSFAFIDLPNFDVWIELSLNSP